MPQDKLELHGFVDASTVAYAAAVYLNVTSPSRDVRVSLVTSKLKAPLVTMPRLELSALLLTRLMTSVRITLGLATIPCICWTDSTIVLAWIRSHPSRWTTYVANRVNKIQTEMPNAV